MIYYQPSQAYYKEFTTQLYATGAIADADVLPTVLANINGVDDANFVLTVTKVAASTGRYIASGTVPSTYVDGDIINVSCLATVGGVAAGGVIDTFCIAELSLQETIERGAVTNDAFRDEFRELSGLIDLADHMVNRWLNRGAKFLDQQVDFQYSDKRQAIVGNLGDWLIRFSTDCRTIKDVYLIDSAGTRTKLEVLNHRRFYELYAKPNTSDGVPVACALVTTQAYNALSATGGVPVYDDFVESTVDGATYRALMFNCTLDKEYQVEIFGKFYSTLITNDDLSNWWAQNFPETLMAAALYKLNLVMYRNTEGAKDYLNEVNQTIMQLNNDSAAEDSEGITVLEG